MKKMLAFTMALMMLVLTACGGSTSGNSAGADVDLQAFYDSLAQEYQWDEVYLVDIEGEMLEGYYPGLNEIPVKQFIAKMPMMSAVVNELVFLQCETEEDAAKAAEILQDRIDYQVGDENNPGGAWYPESIESWKKAQVIQHGTYVAMIASAEYQEAVSNSFNALFA